MLKESITRKLYRWSWAPFYKYSLFFPPVVSDLLPVDYAIEELGITGETEADRQKKLFWVLYYNVEQERAAMMKKVKIAKKKNCTLEDALAIYAEITGYQSTTVHGAAKSWVMRDGD